MAAHIKQASKKKNLPYTHFLLKTSRSSHAYDFSIGGGNVAVIGSSLKDFLINEI